ncbi:MAG TPA: hypothetical protein VMV57_06070 [Terracidiphilus sp.]|nr:hypothetical protein [Terracidiphilus sp.]
MRILKYALWVVFFVGIYLMGKMIQEQNQRLAIAVTHQATPPEGLCKFFRYTGETIQVVAAVWGFLDMVAVLVLVF